MTGNVAQVFRGDEAWAATLRAIRKALRPGGRLVFESRDPRKWFALYLMPGVGRRMMARYRRMPPEALVAGMLSRCCVDASRVPADIVALQVAVARQRTSFPDFEQDFAAAMRSVIAAVGNLRNAAYRQAIRRVSCPVLLVHGARDRIVPIVVARAAARPSPSWSLVGLPGVGHVPQLEAPGDTTEAIVGWLSSADLSAAG
jgi:pimeloyl-ACP methyl ester carboxylesterase